ncbi:glutathione S-transferase family protein [Phenylobacterium sp.]|uniref:glutathione S-transferase family protein n=1 Tax=Phenylobacterium sp. TaxID=1871053 RepID=UPI0027163A35|nr:glutathione S-transferase family protein [Phenylobacterium sp.]MDO8380591.1 glutathione S-transferase family protein [Phenylobacterium sp.]
MSDQLVFYTNPMSRGRIIRWMLEEVGQPYETVLMEFPALKAPDFLAINPMGKVPTIRHGDTVVTEAAAICAYLADAFPQANLAPPHGSRLRGDYYRWLFFAAGPLESAVTVKSLGFEVPADRHIMAGWGCMANVMDTLEKAVTGADYVAGDRFTAADLYLGAHLGWGLQMGSIEPRPAFAAYAERMAARPAAVRAREIDDALIKA